MTIIELPPGTRLEIYRPDGGKSDIYLVSDRPTGMTISVGTVVVHVELYVDPWEAQWAEFCRKVLEPITTAAKVDSTWYTRPGWREHWPKYTASVPILCEPERPRRRQRHDAAQRRQQIRKRFVQKLRRAGA